MGIIDVGSATHEGIYTEQTMQRHSYGWVRAEAFEAGRRALSKGPLRHYCVIQLKCTGDVTTRLPPVWQSPAVSAGPGGLCAVPWRRESVTQYDDG